MEFFDILDEKGNPTGEVKLREEVHRTGLLHGTVHTWIVRRNLQDETGLDVLLQKRSQNKDSYPGCYDISSAGHISAGQTPQEAVVRELYEELGLQVPISALTYLFQHEAYHRDVFYGELFLNHELSWVYLYEQDISPSDCTPQPEEVEAVCWMPGSVLASHLEQKDPQFCVYQSEWLQVLAQYKLGGHSDDKD